MPRANPGLYGATPLVLGKSLFSHASVIQCPFGAKGAYEGVNHLNGEAVDYLLLKLGKPAEEKMERAKGFEPSTFTLAR